MENKKEIIEYYDLDLTDEDIMIGVGISCEGVNPYDEENVYSSSQDLFLSNEDLMEN